MQVFTYTARDSATGEKIKADVEAETVAAASKVLLLKKTLQEAKRASLAEKLKLKIRLFLVVSCRHSSTLGCHLCRA
jgi:hypothetical protein